MAPGVEPGPPAPEQPAGTPETVGALAELYLGNLLYALERAALSLEQESQAENAAFYRGIARKLAEAHGRSKPAAANHTGGQP